MNKIFTLIISASLITISAAGQDTMYVHQNGGVIAKFAVSKIDSVIFYKSTSPLVTDIDGNGYNTITIGTQTWLKENLKVTRLNDGTTIPLMPDIEAWSHLSTPGFCWYNNNSTSYKNIYGALYNWYTVNTGKLCPTGWHVPSDEEWTVLTDFLGTGGGSKMKEAGTSHWTPPNDGATNSSGFTGLPGGFRDDTGVFSGMGDRGFWWSSSVSSATYAWLRSLYYTSTNVSRGTYNRMFGYSIRCLKN